MVKNTTGGSKHKSSARKHAAPTSYSNKDRLPSSPFERVAAVEKMLGNGMCQVITIEDRPLTLICHIRGKFSGKQKSQNIVTTKSFLIVGLRDWEAIPKHCDLLEILTGNYGAALDEPDNIYANDVIFTNEEQSEIDEQPEIEGLDRDKEINKELVTKNSRNVIKVDDEEINIDDI
jgi:hypothetical protein